MTKETAEELEKREEEELKRQKERLALEQQLKAQAKKEHKGYEAVNSEIKLKTTHGVVNLTLSTTDDPNVFLHTSEEHPGVVVRETKNDTGFFKFDLPDDTKKPTAGEEFIIKVPRLGENGERLTAEGSHDLIILNHKGEVTSFAFAKDGTSQIDLEWLDKKIKSRGSVAKITTNQGINNPNIENTEIPEATSKKKTQPINLASVGNFGLNLSAKKDVTIKNKIKNTNEINNLKTIINREVAPSVNPVVSPKEISSPTQNNRPTSINTEETRRTSNPSLSKDSVNASVASPTHATELQSSNTRAPVATTVATSSSALTIISSQPLFSKKEFSLYDILGVKSNLTLTELNKAYKKAVLMYYPDKTIGSEELFKNLSNDYQKMKEDLEKSQNESSNNSKASEIYTQFITSGEAKEANKTLLVTNGDDQQQVKKSFGANQGQVSESIKYEKNNSRTVTYSKKSEDNINLNNNKADSKTNDSQIISSLTSVSSSKSTNAKQSIEDPNSQMNSGVSTTSSKSKTNARGAQPKSSPENNKQNNKRLKKFRLNSRNNPRIKENFIDSLRRTNPGSIRVLPKNTIKSANGEYNKQTKTEQVKEIEQTVAAEKGKRAKKKSVTGKEVNQAATQKFQRAELNSHENYNDPVISKGSSLSYAEERKTILKSNSNKQNLRSVKVKETQLKIDEIELDRDPYIEKNAGIDKFNKEIFFSVSNNRRQENQTLENIIDDSELIDKASSTSSAALIHKEFLQNHQRLSNSRSKKKIDTDLNQSLYTNQDQVVILNETNQLLQGEIGFVKQQKEIINANHKTIPPNPLLKNTIGGDFDKQTQAKVNSDELNKRFAIASAQVVSTEQNIKDKDLNNIREQIKIIKDELTGNKHNESKGSEILPKGDRGDYLVAKIAGIGKEYGAELAKTQQGETPIIVAAAKNQHFRAVAALAKLPEIDVNARDSNNKTALDYINIQTAKITGSNQLSPSLEKTEQIRVQNLIKAKIILEEKGGRTAQDLDNRKELFKIPEKNNIRKTFEKPIAVLPSVPQVQNLQNINHTKNVSSQNRLLRSAFEVNKF